MSRETKAALLLTLVIALLTLQPAAAQEPCQLVLQVFRARAGARIPRLLDPSQLQRLVQAGDLTLLESGSSTGTMGTDEVVFTGTKFPILYQDPRAGGEQVQYVDCGLKMYIRPSAMADHSVRVDVAIDRFALVEGTALSSQDGLAAKTMFVARPDQTAIVATVRGRIGAPYLKRAYPNVSESDTLLFAVTVRR